MTAEGLEFRLEPRPGRVTTADLSVFVRGRPVWPVAGDERVKLEIQLDDLLAHLTEFWSLLMLRQTYPVDVPPERPVMLRAEAERTWAQRPAASVEAEDEAISAFEEAHDVAKAFAGLFDVAPLYLLRSGERMIVDTRDRPRDVSFKNAADELARVGDAIASRLAGAEPDRWADLIEAWEARDADDPISLVRWSTSLDQGSADRFVTLGLIEAPASVSAAANDDDELRVAARMASALPSDQIEEILRTVRGFEGREARRLDELSEAVSGHVADRFERHRAFEQGEAAARRTREILRLRDGEAVDVLGLLRRLGVSVHERRSRVSSLKALAVWGRRHGPAVLLVSKDVRWTRGRRPHPKPGQRRRFHNVTLAHELCHFLLDRGHALSAVEVLNSRMPHHVESRAVSFAGEFLLPARTAAEGWTEADRPLPRLNAYLDGLEREYGVTRSVAAWKLEHGLKMRDIDVSVLLDQVAPRRWSNPALPA